MSNPEEYETATLCSLEETKTGASRSLIYI